MSDYFTHLARRTLGVAAGSDARPIRSARALSDAPRPALFPDEAESVPAHASVPSQNTQQEAALRPHSVDAARAQRSRSRSVETLQTDSLSETLHGDPLAPLAVGLGSQSVAATPDALREQTVAFELSTATVETQAGRTEMTSPPVPTQSLIMPSVRDSLARSQKPSTSMKDTLGPGLDAALASAGAPQADSVKQSDNEVARSEFADLFTESLRQIPVDSIRTVEREPSNVLDPAASKHDFPDSHRVDAPSSKRASVSTQVTAAAAHKKAFTQNEASLITEEQEPSASLRLSSSDVVRSDENRLGTEIATEAKIQTKSDAKTWTSDPFADTPSGSLRMGSSAQKATAPQVHIHIGRIEVRSPQVMQPQRQTASAESRPTLSLASVLSMAKGK